MYLCILPFYVDCNLKYQEFRKIWSFKVAQNGINDNEKMMNKCSFLAKYEEFYTYVYYDLALIASQNSEN